MQKASPVLVADRFPRLLDALLETLEGLASEDWKRPTAAAGWSVHDVALHLLGVDINQISSKRDHYSEGHIDVKTWGELVELLNRRNAEWVAAMRRISPRLTCELLRFSGDRVNRLIASLDPFAMGGAVSWAGPDPAPVWLDVAREFTERWHHQQHIREAVGAPVLDDPYFLAPVLATFARGLPRTLQDVQADEGTTATLTITGDAGGMWTVASEAGAWRLYEGMPERPRANVVISQDTAWRLYTKGLTLQVARERAELRGDGRLGEILLRTVSIIA